MADSLANSMAELPVVIEKVAPLLDARPSTWLVTGAAGFIGSHLVETLLHLGQRVIGVDNFLTGKRTNLSLLSSALSSEQASRFSFHEVDIRQTDEIEGLLKGTRYVLHQAALGSVPRSIENPLLTLSINVDGFASVLHGSARVGVERFVYASSSSVYGDSTASPKTEKDLGNPLSPYALSKDMDEQLTALWSQLFKVTSVGLRYFNVFGPRQSPDGPYAAVIPQWVLALLDGSKIRIFGDGETTRDFCYVGNAVYANLLSALKPLQPFSHQVFNVAGGKQTSLNTLLKILLAIAETHGYRHTPEFIEFANFREGDIRESLADLTSISNVLGYSPLSDLQGALETTFKSFLPATDSTS